MNTLDQPAPAPSTVAPDSPARAAAAGRSVVPAGYERLIQPTRGWVAVDWQELYQYRDLFESLIMRDIRVRYKQTTFGVAWAVVQPLISMIVFSVLFRNIPGLQPPGVPYALFILSGLVPWTFFSGATTSAGVSLLSQQHLLSKVYFPRLYVPATNTGAYAVDLGIGLLLVGLLLPYYGQAPTLRLLALPLIVGLNFLAAFGLGLILASVTVVFRDLRFLIPFGMQILMFASPIIYPVTALPERIRLLVDLNPMTGIISAYRWALLGMELDGLALAIALVVIALCLTAGLFLFRRSERLFADVL